MGSRTKASRTKARRIMTATATTIVTTTDDDHDDRRDRPCDSAMPAGSLSHNVNVRLVRA